MPAGLLKNTGGKVYPIRGVVGSGTPEPPSTWDQIAELLTWTDSSTANTYLNRRYDPTFAPTYPADPASSIPAGTFVKWRNYFGFLCEVVYRTGSGAALTDFFNAERDIEFTDSNGVRRVIMPQGNATKFIDTVGTTSTSLTSVNIGAAAANKNEVRPYRNGFFIPANGTGAIYKPYPALTTTTLSTLTPWGDSNARTAFGDGNDPVPHANGGIYYIYTNDQRNNCQVLNLMTGRQVVQSFAGDTITYTEQTPGVGFTLPATTEYAHLSADASHIVVHVTGTGMVAYSFTGQVLGTINSYTGHTSPLMLTTASGLKWAQIRKGVTATSQGDCTAIIYDFNFAQGLGYPTPNNVTTAKIYEGSEFAQGALGQTSNTLGGYTFITNKPISGWTNPNYFGREVSFCFENDQTKWINTGQALTCVMSQFEQYSPGDVTNTQPEPFATRPETIERNGLKVGDRVLYLRIRVASELMVVRMYIPPIPTLARLRERGVPV